MSRLPAKRRSLRDGAGDVACGARRSPWYSSWHWPSRRAFSGSSLVGPGVGHFRSVEGRAAYVDAYGRGMSALPSPTATHDVVTDLGTVHAYEWSSPELTDTVPIVLIPGRTSGVPMWLENLPGFLKDHRVIAFDALGDAGLSVQGAPMESFEDQALWMEQVLAELAPSGAHLVGHSFGGATAATYAHRFPAAWSR